MRGCRSSAASKGRKGVLDEEEAPAGPTRRVTRRLATQAADSQLSPQVPAAETEPKVPSSSASRRADLPAQSPAMHTPTDKAPNSVTPAARAVTRAAAANRMHHSQAAKTGSRAGATPAGKPPLPPTASKALSAYRSAQRQKEAPTALKEAPTALKARTVKTRGSSPGTAPAASPGSPSGSSLAAAAAAADDAMARPVTRRSAQQLSTSSPGAEPSCISWAAETASPPTTRGRSKEGAADRSEGASQRLVLASHDRSAEAQQAQPAASGKQAAGSKKRTAEVALSELAIQGESC